MTILGSQGIFASAQAGDEATFTTTDTEGQSVPEVVPARDPWLIRASIHAFGPCTSRALDRPLPDITDSLAARILRVSEYIEHARQNGHLKGAANLLTAESIYNTAVQQCLKDLRTRNSVLYWKLDEELRRKPTDIESMKGRLSREFDLFTKGHSGQRFFHFRNNTAYLYEQANGLKDGPSPS